MTSVAIVGGGISGLAAAYELRRALGDSASIVLFEASSRLGGKLYTAEVADSPFDLGAESFICRRPEVLELAEELGLTDSIVHPRGLTPTIYARGQHHQLPQETLMGIPSSASSVTELFDDTELRRIEDEPVIPLTWTPGQDATVGDLVGSRFGQEVVRRLVDPFLGGVYSGYAESIGVRAALPTLAAALDSGAASLTEAVRLSLPKQQQGAVFGAFAAGYQVFVEALAKSAQVHTGVEITQIQARGSGWN
ncbi:MAG: protoporphyrinogen oxidase, partial [Mycobacteriaceae bacterium]